MDGGIVDGWSMFLFLKFWRVCFVLINKKKFGIQYKRIILFDFECVYFVDIVEI